MVPAHRIPTRCAAANTPQWPRTTWRAGKSLPVRSTPTAPDLLTLRAWRASGSALREARSPGLRQSGGPQKDHIMLTQAQRDLLDFEQQHPRMSVQKQQLVREKFNEHPAAYYVRLVAATLSPEAAQVYPEIVARTRGMLNFGAPSVSIGA